MSRSPSGPVRRLKGKVAVVTASTEGIGYAVAKRLAVEGASVLISSRRQKNVDRAVQELKEENLNVYGIVCHVGKAEDRRRLLEQVSEEIWDKIFDINLKSAFFLCKEAIPLMEARGGGNIVFVSSIGGYMPSEVIGAYSVSKTALLGLTKAMTPQCATKNIRVNGIAPGLIKTKFSEALWRPSEANEKYKQLRQSRPGTADECAGAVAYFVSDDASYVTGETLVISGGGPSRL